MIYSETNYPIYDIIINIIMVTTAKGIKIEELEERLMKINMMLATRNSLDGWEIGHWENLKEKVLLKLNNLKDNI